MGLINAEPLSRGTINVDHRTSHTFPTAVIQAILKPIGNRILKPGTPLPKGSPKLTR